MYCDQTNSDGGWTVFQRRVDGSQDFFKDWAAYERGFGRVKKEYWLGFGKILRLIGNRRQKLRIDMEDTAKIKKYAEYEDFKVLGPETNYRLSIGQYSGKPVILYEHIQAMGCNDGCTSM